MIYREEKDQDHPFTMASNKIFQNENLSWKAKGLICYLLSLPDDWKIYESEITNHSKDKIASTRTAVKELIKEGYIIRKRLQDEKGRFKGYEYDIYENPSTVMRFSENGLSENGESHTTNTYSTKTYGTKSYKGNNSEENSPMVFSWYHKLFHCDHDIFNAVSYYLDKYQNYSQGKEHPKLKDYQWKRVVDKITYIDDKDDHLSYEEVKQIIDKHFITEYENCDYNILHFISGDIIKLRFMEAVLR